MAESDLTLIVRSLLARAPEWLRRDLSAKDPAIRTRAEEALAVLITSAITGPSMAEAPPVFILGHNDEASA